MTREAFCNPSCGVNFVLFKFAISVAQYGDEVGKLLYSMLDLILSFIK